MGFKTSSTRFTQAKSAQSSDVVAFNNATGGTSVAGSGVTATTVINTVVTTPGAPATSTTIASGPTIANIQYLDANNAVISGDIAVSTTGGNILITGSGFVANSSVYLNNYLISNTFISSTQIRAVCPAASSGNVTLMIFTPTNIGTIASNSVRYSGAPTWTTAAVSFQNNAAGNVALVASSDSTLTYTLQAGSTLPTGISLVSAGYLSGTATGYSVNTSGTAVIVATDLEGQATQQTLNITITVADPQFNYTTLLLNGETSVTPFIADASTNNLPLTVVGDTRATKFSPYRGDGYYSNSFNGSTDYFTVPSNAAFQLGTGDFTIELWFMIVGAGDNRYQHIIQSRDGTNNGFLVQYDRTNGTIELTSDTGFTGAISANNAILDNTWYHFAATRSGTSVKIFLNGTQVGTTVTSAQNLTASGPVYVSRRWVTDGALHYVNGYISNLRILKGTAQYTGNFTPSATPLTAIANTSLLTCQSNRFIDKSASAVALTLAGTPQVSPAIPFAANSSYATYGSAYFDGTGDSLTIPSSSALALGTGDFTVECWFYTSSATAAILDIRNTVSQVAPFLILLTQTLRWYVSGGYQITSSTLALNTWYHVAVVRSSSTTTMYLNGVQTGSTYADTNNYIANTAYIGGAFNSSQMTTGYIADLRVIKGTALYTTTFTPPTAPLSAVANTQLLTLQYNGGGNNYGIIDNGPFNNALTRVGNATQGTFSPYSPTGWSNYFGGSDYLTFTGTASQGVTFGAGDFTVELWYYMTNNTTNTTYHTFIRQDATTNGFDFGYRPSATQLVLGYAGVGEVVASTTLSLNTWNHVAVSRSGTSLKFFVNGTQVGTTATNSYNFNATGTSGIGRNSYNAAYTPYGYISNIRASNVALYTAAFTPSTTPLTATANTTFLSCQSNRFKDNSANNFTLTATGTLSVQAHSPFSPGVAYNPSLHGGSTYFDGTGDYLTTPANPVLTLGGDFTIECWVYTTIANQTYGSGILGTYDGGSNGGWSLTINRSSGGPYGIIFVHANALQQTTASYLPINTWHHIAIARSGTTLRTFLNGTQVATGTYATADAVSAICYVGSQGVGSYHSGYISDVRVVKGAALYTTTFTPPTNTLTSPTTTPAGLLLNFSNGGIVDQSSKVILDQQTTPPPQLSTNIKKYGTSSIDCTGGKYMYNSLASQNLAIGTGDFTFEAWIYVTNTNVNGGMINLGSAISNEQLNFHVYLTTLFPYFGGSARNAGTAPSNTWNHYAIVRQNGVSKFYLDGVFNTSIGAIADSTNYTTSVLLLGAYQSTLTASCYIDDLRITKGFARYTANFTPPTSGVLGQ